MLRWQRSGNQHTGGPLEGPWVPLSTIIPFSFHVLAHETHLLAHGGLCAVFHIREETPDIFLCKGWTFCNAKPELLMFLWWRQIPSRTSNSQGCTRRKLLLEPTAQTNYLPTPPHCPLAKQANQGRRLLSKYIYHTPASYGPQCPVLSPSCLRQARPPR